VVCLKSLALRKWQGDTGCYFCGMPENCDHLLFECPIAKVIWGVIVICFQQKTRPFRNLGMEGVYVRSCNCLLSNLENKESYML
jgi:hypothetical protein